MSNDRAVTLGKKFKEAREKLGLTQLDVSKKVDLNVTHYAKIERGDVTTSFENIETISKILKIKPSKLLK
jgi:transcriptional regulator with XRE-family HTH domain